MVYAGLRKRKQFVLWHLELFSARLPVKVLKTLNDRQSYIHSTFRLTFLNRHMIVWFSWIFLDLWNLLKRQDCRSFSILKTLTGFRPYIYSHNSYSAIDLSFLKVKNLQLTACRCSLRYRLGDRDPSTHQVWKLRPKTYKDPSKVLRNTPTSNNIYAEKGFNYIDEWFLSASVVLVPEMTAFWRLDMLNLTMLMSCFITLVFCSNKKCCFFLLK